MIDILIVGGGSAGLSAAVTAKARNKNALVIGNGAVTSAIFKAERIDNYLGFYGITGEQMMDTFTKHAQQMGVDMARGRVLQIMSMGDYFSVNAGEEIYDAKTIILATGINRAGRIKGEKEFLGKGLSYCATCDGMLYRGKTVVITGEGEEMLQDTRFLSEICKNVIVVAEKDLDIEDIENVEVKKGKIKEIKGNIKVSSVITEAGEIECDGVFIISGGIPADALIYGIEINDGVIATDKSMKTNIPGVFAAGDCTGKPFQISKAVGEGLVAALSAVSYI